jgi:hypothetical protein
VPLIFGGECCCFLRADEQLQHLPVLIKDGCKCNAYAIILPSQPVSDAPRLELLHHSPVAIEDGGECRARGCGVLLPKARHGESGQAEGVLHARTLPLNARHANIAYSHSCARRPAIITHRRVMRTVKMRVMYELKCERQKALFTLSR